MPFFRKRDLSIPDDIPDDININDKDITPSFARFEQIIQTAKEARDSYYKSFETDKLAAFMVHRLHLTPNRAAVLGIVIVLFFYIMAYLGNSLNIGKSAGMYVAFYDFTYDIILVPMAFWFYIWISTRPQELLLRLTLAKNKSNTSGQKTDNFGSSVCYNRVHRPFWAKVGLIIAAIFLISTEYGTLVNPFVWGDESSSFILLRFYKIPFVWALPLYMVIVIFGKQIIMAWSMRKELKQLKRNIATKRLSASAIEHVSKYFSTFSIFLSACLFGFVILVFRSLHREYFEIDYFVHFGFFCFAVASAFFLFYPLRPLGDIVNKLKEIEILDINILFGVPAKAFATYSIAIFAPILSYYFFRIVSFGG